MTVAPRLITPVILCGGMGTRLWPRSRAAKPKPFLPLIGEDTLFRQALVRCADPALFSPPVVVAGKNHLRHVLEQADIAPDASIIVEPMAKSTAAAIALAAMRLTEDAMMLICPSDHHIGDQPSFIRAVRLASELARIGWLATLGIDVCSADPRFGYIKRGQALGDRGFIVAEFAEKPDQARADAFLLSGEYFWNSGIFMFRARDYLTELGRHRPKLVAAVRKSVETGCEDGKRIYPGKEAFSQIEAESVDRALMENTSQAVVIPANMGWSDVGDWLALRAARHRDRQGNTVRGPAELVDCRNVLVDTDGPHVSAIGLDDMIIVVDGDQIVVMSAADAQQIGKLSGPTIE